MIKTSIKLQDLRRKIYVKSKAEPDHRFWGLYVHVCKTETLKEGYRLVKLNGGSAGIDNQTLNQIEESGVDTFISELQQSLLERTYLPSVNRKVKIPKGKGKHRVLGISTIKDRVVQAALKLILEPIFEADFQEGSYWLPSR